MAFSFAAEARLPAELRVGTKERNFLLIQQRTYFAQVDDKANFDGLINRSIGPFVAQNSFTFGSDATSKWFNATEIDGHNGTREVVNEILYAHDQLGSIDITGFVLGFEKKEHIWFWIEASEGDKQRVYTSGYPVDGTAFPNSSPNWKFSACWIASGITGLF